MANFELAADNNVRLDQLGDEIYQATGIDLGSGLEIQIALIPPRTIRLPDSLVPDQATHDAIQAIVDVHVPNPLYFDDDTDEASAKEEWQELKGLWAPEVAYLEAAIPAIDDMTAGEARSMVKRLAQENYRILRAFKLLFRRLT